MEHRDPLALQGPGKPAKPVAGQGERAHRRAGEEGPEDVGRPGAEARRREQRQPVLRGQAERPREPAHVVQDVAVRVHDSLGSPGRSRREEDVRQVVGRGGGRRAGRLAWRRELLQAPRGSADAREVPAARERRRVRDQHGRVEALPDGLQTRVRKARIERDVEAAGLQHAEHRREEGRARFRDEHDGTRLLPEACGKRRGGGVRGSFELAIGGNTTPLAHGRPVRLRSRDLSEALEDRAFDLDLRKVGRHRSPEAESRIRRRPRRAPAGRGPRPSNRRMARTRPRRPSTRST